jgi:hypothetical protein
MSSGADDRSRQEQVLAGLRAALEGASAELKALHGVDPALLNEVDTFAEFIRQPLPVPAVVQHTGGTDQDELCRSLLNAFNSVRGQISFAAGNDSFGEGGLVHLNADPNTRHAQALLAQLDRIERAMMEAGCPLPGR